MTRTERISHNVLGLIERSPDGLAAFQISAVLDEPLDLVNAAILLLLNQNKVHRSPVFRHHPRTGARCRVYFRLRTHDVGNPVDSR